MTESYKEVLPAALLKRYRFREVRNAAAVLKASNPERFDEIVGVLQDFEVLDDDILSAGGNRGPIAIRLDGAFEKLGWSAVRIDTATKLVGRKKRAPHSRTYDIEYLDSFVTNPGYEVDNMKGRVALDVEWNSKDGNLDRDLSSFRALYELALIDVAVIIVRDFASIRELALNDLGSTDAYRRLGTATCASFEKTEGRLTRGDSGGCPVLVAAITRATWRGHAG